MFTAFSKLVHSNLQRMQKQELYVTVDGNKLWQTYLDSFPAGSNPIYKEHTEHDCQCCRNFIRNYGNVVALVDGKPESVWGSFSLPYPYQDVAEALDKLVTETPITGIFRTKEQSYGAEVTHQKLESEVKTWNHFHGTVAAEHRSTTPDAAIGQARTNQEVFSRSLGLLKEEHIDTVLELIADNNLYRGAEFTKPLQHFKQALRAYKAAPDKHLFTWTAGTPTTIGFKNTAIGSLIEDLSKDVPLDDAVRMWDSKMAPTNYKRPKAIVTQKMVDEGLALIAAEGLEDALSRRQARLSDVTINNVIWASNEAKALMKSSIANLLQSSVVVAAPKTTQEVAIDDFLANILPKAKTLDLLMENSKANNLVTLTAPVHTDAPPLFKWDNNFAWSYNGNIADSDMRRAVQARGGSVTGVFRFTHSWNYGKRNSSLMDLHVFMPGCQHETKPGEHYPAGHRVGWNQRQDAHSGGVQDVDYTLAAPVGHVPVENITFPDLRRMPEGDYMCKIHNWQLRQPTEGGFKAEIEFSGQIFEYEYDEKMGHKEWVDVATVNLKDGVFTIKHHLPCGQQSKDLWNIKTESFVPVQTVLNSPNHWDGNATGNRHTFFMLEGCKNPDPVRGIYNEFLRPELEKHRKVFELLGAKTMCPPTDDQLSGVGFSSTKQDKVTVRVDGAKSYTITF